MENQEPINPVDFIEGQVWAGKYLVDKLEELKFNAKYTADNYMPGDEEYPKSWFRGGEMFFSLALTKINQLIKSLKQCADDLERNEYEELPL